jgi:hypothetical protein
MPWPTKKPARSKTGIFAAIPARIVRLTWPDTPAQNKLIQQNFLPILSIFTLDQPKQ